MNLGFLRTASLLAATVTTGLIAGLFAAFSYAVMPGLAGAGDRTFVEAMQKINVAIINGWFMLCFLGGLLFTIVALVLHARSGRGVLPWIIAGFVLYGVMFVITSAVNVPLNDQLAKAGHSVAAARRHFESTWVTWNVIRTITTVAAFAALSWALVLHGRAGATVRPGRKPSTATGAPLSPSWSGRP